jgi:polyribonucleotide 5'-hydroxyl-kinase
VTPKIIKLPRSGGIVSRNDQVRRIIRSSSIRKYFHGDVVPLKAAAGMPSSTTNSSSNNSKSIPLSFAYRFAPSIMELEFSDVTLFKTSQVSLSKNTLTIGGTQLSSKVQLEKIDATTFGASLVHMVLAVCHPASVDRYHALLREAGAGDGGGDDLYGDDDTMLDDDIVAKANEALFGSSVAGFVTVEKVDAAKQRLSLLSPCSGDLPSKTFLLGDIAWTE